MKTERLSYEQTKNPNAVEENFCKDMDKATRVEMDEETTKTLIQLMMSRPVPLSSVAKKDKFFLFELIEKRVEHCFTFKITDARVIVFLALISESAGTAIMYLTYLQYRLKKVNRTELTLDYLCELFPHIFIPKSELQDIWDRQKISKPSSIFGSDNLLDYQSAMKSIQFELEVKM